MGLKKTLTANRHEVTLIQRYFAGEKEAEKALCALVDELLEKALRALELKGTFFPNREDVKQEIMVAILTGKQTSALQNFKGGSRLSTYLWSIIRFKLIDMLRKEMVASGRMRSLTEDTADPYAAQEGLPDELFHIIDLFLDKSSDKEAFVLRLRWLEGRDYRSICRQAEKMGYRLSAMDVGNLLFRKRKELLCFLKKRGYELSEYVKSKV